MPQNADELTLIEGGKRFDRQAEDLVVRRPRLELPETVFKAGHRYRSISSGLRRTIKGGIR